MARSQLQRDIDDFDTIDRMMRSRGGVDVSSPAVSDPREVDLSDHFRISSPNRVKGQGDSGKMRHRRSRK